MTDNLNPEGFDLDAWIDGVERPTITVDLFPFEDEFAARVAEIESRIEAAEKVTADNRGIGDESPESMVAQLDELRREREAKTVRVQVRQVTTAESIAIVRAHKDRAEGDPENVDVWMVAAACVDPAFTPQQMERLRTRDRTGEAMYAQLYVATEQVLRGLPVPS